VGSPLNEKRGHATPQPGMEDPRGVEKREGLRAGSHHATAGRTGFPGGRSVNEDDAFHPGPGIPRPG